MIAAVLVPTGTIGARIVTVGRAYSSTAMLSTRIRYGTSSGVVADEALTKF
jgi:hypothetical protein